MSWENATKLAEPFFAMPIGSRLLYLALIGAMIFCVGGEFFRFAAIRIATPPKSTLATTAPRGSGTISAAEPQPQVPSTKASKRPTKTVTSEAPTPSTVTVGPVNSTNQTGGITSGYIGSVQQSNGDPKQ